MFSQPAAPPVPANQFDYLGVIHGLAPEKPLIQQKGSITSYEILGKKTPVEINHGVILIFHTTDDQYYVLGKTRVNPAGDNPTELQASLGDLGDGYIKIDTSKSLKKTLQDNINKETNQGWSLSQFELSSDYVCHRVKEWSVCYLKMAALCKTEFSDATLKQRISQINANISSENKYGLYLLSEIVDAAKLTIGLAEGSHKPKSIVTNHLTNGKTPVVIFDDYAIATLFTAKNNEELFPQLLERKPGVAPR